MADLTCGIKSFRRRQSLNRLIESVSLHLPGAIIKIDEETDNLSAGRNHLVYKLETDFFLLLDDDYEMILNNNVFKVLDIMKREDIDITCGMLYLNGVHPSGHEKDLVIKDRKVYKNLPSRKMMQIDGLQFNQIDMGLNFFLAKKDVFNKVQWDVNFPINAEHLDFFLMAKSNGVKVFYCPEMAANHLTVPGDDEYKRLRGRNDSLIKLADKWNIDYICEGDLVQNLRV